MENAHRVTYQLTLDDFKALQKMSEKQSASQQRLWNIFTIVVGTIVAGYSLWLRTHAPRPRLLHSYQPTPLMTLNSLLGVVVLSIPIYFVMQHFRRKADAELLREIQHTVTAWLEPDGFFTEGHHGENRQRWDTLHDLTETPTHLFLWLTKNAAHIVPKSAFDSSERAEAFCRAAWEYWNTSRCGA
jgi:hypothetical protein